MSTWERRLLTVLSVLAVAATLWMARYRVVFCSEPGVRGERCWVLDRWTGEISLRRP